MAFYFLVKLIPPRPSFIQDMNDEEKQVMKEHVEYWTGLAMKGNAILFAPVIDPKGPYGMGVLEVDAEPDVRDITANDPAMKSGRGFMYEIFAMPRVALREKIRG